MDKNKMIAVAVVVVLVGAGSFYGGMKYAEGKGGRNARGGQFAVQFGNGQGGQNGGTFRAGGARGGGFVVGEILSKDDKSITVKSQDGGSKIVFLTASTSIMKSSSGSLTDLVVGENVMVQGGGNSDGSVNAQSIQLRPAFPARTPGAPQQ